jgi:hypothetical protein
LQLAPTAIFALAVVAGGVERGVVTTFGVGLGVEGGLVAAGDGGGDETGARDAGGGGVAEVEVATGATADDGEIPSLIGERGGVAELSGVGDGNDLVELIERDGVDVSDVCIGQHCRDLRLQDLTRVFTFDPLSFDLFL